MTKPVRMVATRLSDGARYPALVAPPVVPTPDEAALLARERRREERQGADVHRATRQAERLIRAGGKRDRARARESLAEARRRAAGSSGRVTPKSSSRSVKAQRRRQSR